MSTRRKKNSSNPSRVAKQRIAPTQQVDDGYMASRFPEVNRRWRGRPFLPPFNSTIPQFGDQCANLEAAEIVVHEHYEFLGCHWWLSEYDAGADMAFGFACLGENMLDVAEWGPFTLQELESLRYEVDVVIEGESYPYPMVAFRDEYFEPGLASDIMPAVLGQEFWWSKRTAPEVEA